MEIHIISDTRLESNEIADLSEYILENSINPPFTFTYANSLIKVFPAEQTIFKQYSLSTEPPEPLEINNTILYTSQSLPHASLEFLNTTLKFPNSLTKKLENYVKLIISNKFPSLHLHKLLLLTGPPGGGKTSLALKIFQNAAYTTPNALLITVNAHALFSKYFSESGKIVQKLFTQIIEEAESHSIFLLIDEIESLASTRNAENEPTDSVRAANAVLTQLDQLRSCNNIITICTSNLTGVLDPAFLDRCDIIQEIKLPDLEQRKEILANVWSGISSDPVIEIGEVAKVLEGFSGRKLRKIAIEALIDLEEEFTQEEFWQKLSEVV